MKPVPLIRASAAIHLAKFLRHAGGELQPVWEGAGLPAGALADPARLIPLRSMLQLFELAAEALGMDDLGRRVARDSGLRAVGPFGSTMLSAPTLYAAMQAAVTHVEGHNSGAKYWIAADGPQIRFCRRFRIDETSFRQVDLFTLELMFQLVRRFAGDDWCPDRIELQSTGADGAVVRAQLGLPAACEVAAGRRATSVRVARALLACAIRPSAVVTTRDADGRWHGPLPPRDFARSLELVVESILESGRSFLGAVALASGTETRTLQRHLAEAGLTLRDVVHRVRLRKATELLADDALRVTDVAHAIGYSDPAHFTRAFRRWTSMTPLEYRQLRRAEQRRRRVGA